jgi:hypothetical protein
LPNPYKYHFELASNTYKFTTKNSVEYRIAFVIDETFSAISGIEINNIYQIIIEKVTDGAEKFDSLVSLTIKNIVREFFENSENSMIYICDDSDKKATTRFNTFERWYWSSEMTEYIAKVDNIIKCNSENQDFILYTSLLFHKNNTNKKMILEVYNAIEEALNNDK